VSGCTVARQLVQAGLVVPQPKKRPKSSHIRFQADLPNQCWQADVTHYRLTDGAQAQILTFLDDHSRYALSTTARHRYPAPPY
jgi:transposase InsO family protein